jgi:hypothetical protein
MKKFKWLKTHEEMLTIPGHKGNANQNQVNFLLEWLPLRTPPPTNVGEDAGKREPLYVVSGNVS